MVPAIAIAAVVVIGLAVALVISSMRGGDENDAQEAADPPEPIVEQLDESEIAPDGGAKRTPDPAN